jgi:type II secretory ATPase GspE/PulE/Tfp pilus assembly ATPase PilB-like protein
MTNKDKIRYQLLIRYYLTRDPDILMLLKHL